jgi:hypothetical protein
MEALDARVNTKIKGADEGIFTLTPNVHHLQKVVKRFGIDTMTPKIGDKTNLDKLADLFLPKVAFTSRFKETVNYGRNIATLLNSSINCEIRSKYCKLRSPKQLSGSTRYKQIAMLSHVFLFNLVFILGSHCGALAVGDRVGRSDRVSSPLSALCF